MKLNRRDLMALTAAAVAMGMVPAGANAAATVEELVSDFTGGADTGAGGITLTAPEIKACALIAFQSANCTGEAKLVIVLMKASSGISRNNPVPVRSAATTRAMSCAICRAPAVSATKSGTA